MAFIFADCGSSIGVFGTLTAPFFLEHFRGELRTLLTKFFANTNVSSLGIEARQAFLVFDQENRALTGEIRAGRRNQWQSPLSLSPEAFTVATTAAHLRC